MRNEVSIYGGEVFIAILDFLPIPTFVLECYLLTTVSIASVMNAVMSPVKVQSMHEDETVATGIFAEPITSPTRNRHKSKRKKKGDGGSIISSFF